MPEYTVTGPDGTKYPVNAPEGATQDQAFDFFKREWKAGRVQKPTAPAPVSAGHGWDFLKSIPPAVGSAGWDFLKSIPQGMLRGATRAASTVGQAEEGLATGGAQKTVPGPAESAKLAGVERLPQPQGMAGRVGGFVGEVLGTPTTGLPGAGLLPGVGGAVGRFGEMLPAVSRGVAGMSKAPEIEALSQLPNVSHLLTREHAIKQGMPTKAPSMGIPGVRLTAKEVIAARRAEKAAEKAAAEEGVAAVDPEEVLIKFLTAASTRAGRRKLAIKAGVGLVGDAAALSGAGARLVGKNLAKGAIKARALEAQAPRMYEE